MSTPEFAGIGWAIKEMQNGARVARSGWNGKGMWLAYQAGMMRTAGGEFVPWLASQTDILAIDWVAVTP